ncbi:MAG TPA: hypothetical protein VGP68_04040 [Gemmataceae bacterium]|jgi:hypothetical protein|nr:hypothetical protein [Gemmataceae bacterium]
MQKLENPNHVASRRGRSCSDSETVRWLASTSQELPGRLAVVGLGCGHTNSTSTTLKPSINELKLAGATREEVRAHVRRHKHGNGAQQLAKTKRIKVPVPGTNATVVVTAAGDLTLFGFVEVLAELCNLARKAETDGLDATTFERVLRQRRKSKRLA